ncbi:hypothetical protein [Rhizobium leguminosarum]|uniref:hypothetical protein n=1 Tax=Rhizobium leguminosarum TaxID=384 RepID=UPI0021BC26AA|nr:hypothetical protein [Rhizobium leguminosarum]
MNSRSFGRSGPRAQSIDNRHRSAVFRPRLLVRASSLDLLGLFKPKQKLVLGKRLADVHRIFNRGIFLYPADRHKTSVRGRLRLLYEANPIGLLVEAAGSAAPDGRVAILDIKFRSLHQRVPRSLGLP